MKASNNSWKCILWQNTAKIAVYFLCKNVYLSNSVLFELFEGFLGQEMMFPSTLDHIYDDGPVWLYFLVPLLPCHFKYATLYSHKGEDCLWILFSESLLIRAELIMVAPRLTFFFFKILSYLFERQSCRRQEELARSPDGCRSQRSWASSHVGTGSKHFSHRAHAFPGEFVGSWVASGAAGTWAVTLMECWWCRQWLNLQCIIVPLLMFPT